MGITLLRIRSPTTSSFSFGLGLWLGLAMITITVLLQANTALMNLVAVARAPSPGVLGSAGPGLEPIAQLEALLVVRVATIRASARQVSDCG